MAERIASVFGEERSDEFTLDFFADAVVCAMERWLLAKECMPSEEFLEKSRHLWKKVPALSVGNCAR